MAVNALVVVHFLGKCIASLNLIPGESCLGSRGFEVSFTAIPRWQEALRGPIKLW